MAEFKRLSDVEVVAEPAESANVLIEENGIIKKAPKTAIGGNNASGALIINCEYDGNLWYMDTAWQDAYDAYMAGRHVLISYEGYFYDVKPYSTEYLMALRIGEELHQASSSSTLQIHCFGWNKSDEWAKYLYNGEFVEVSY